MNKYLIQLIGEDLDIEDLSHGLRTSKWEIIKDPESYYLTSAALEKLTNKKDVISKCKEFLDMLNGSANIIYNNHKKVSIGNLTTIDEYGNRTINVSGTIQGRSRMRGTATVNNEDLKNEPTTAEDWIDKAYQHKPIRDVLYFFNDLTWSNLYKIYEIIAVDVGGKKDIYKYVDKGKINDFKQTANSREAIGDLARHANGIKAPNVPLTFNEAHAIIKNLFETWIQLKYTSVPEHLNSKRKQ